MFEDIVNAVVIEQAEEDFTLDINDIIALNYINKTQLGKNDINKRIADSPSKIMYIEKQDDKDIGKNESGKSKYDISSEMTYEED